MLKRTLQIIILILLIAINISVHILTKEIEKSISNMDYTIYNIEPVVEKEEDLDTNEETVLQMFIASLKEDSKVYEYKYFKKLELKNYCKCEECRGEWIWDEPPQWKILVSGQTVAANPKTFPIGTHIRINKNYFTVLYNDLSIPLDTIYIYVNPHERNDKSLYLGIYDVYKEK